jgi:hypothetical protein
MTVMPCQSCSISTTGKFMVRTSPQNQNASLCWASSNTFPLPSTITTSDVSHNRAVGATSCIVVGQIVSLDFVAYLFLVFRRSHHQQRPSRRTDRHLHKEHGTTSFSINHIPRPNAQKRTLSRIAVQHGVAVDRFAREIVGFLKAAPGALAATERQAVRRRHQSCTTPIQFIS